jgi:hypothetical protein
MESNFRLVLAMIFDRAPMADCCSGLFDGLGDPLLRAALDSSTPAITPSPFMPRPRTDSIASPRLLGSRRNSIRGVDALPAPIPICPLPSPYARYDSRYPNWEESSGIIHSPALTLSWATLRFWRIWRNGGSTRALPSDTTNSPALANGRIRAAAAQDAAAATSKLTQSHQCIFYMFVCPSWLSLLSCATRSGRHILLVLAASTLNVCVF